VNQAAAAAAAASEAHSFQVNPSSNGKNTFVGEPWEVYRAATTAARAFVFRVNQTAAAAAATCSYKLYSFRVNEQQLLGALCCLG
jgi:hypothetical protein